MFLKTPKLVMVEGETVSTATAILRVSGRHSRNRFAVAARRDCDSADSERGAHLGRRSLGYMVRGTHCCRAGVSSRGADSTNLCFLCPAFNLQRAVSGCGGVAAFISRRQCSGLNGIAWPWSILSRRLAIWAEKAQDWTAHDLEDPSIERVFGVYG